MITVKGKKIIMNKGDYGLPIVYNLTGELLQATDKILFTIDDVIEKEYTLTEDSGKYTFTFELSKEDSDKLTKNFYFYSIKAYREGVLLDTLVDDEGFELI